MLANERGPLKVACIKEIFLKNQDRKLVEPNGSKITRPPEGLW